MRQVPGGDHDSPAPDVHCPRVAKLLAAVSIMTRWRRLWPIVAVVVVVLAAQDPPAEDDALAPADSAALYLPGPILSPSTDELFFEGLLPGESRTLFMDLANLGDGIIHLDSTSISEGAVQFGLPLRAIHPGQFIRFPVTFNQSDLDTHQLTVTIYWRSATFDVKDSLLVTIGSTPLPPLEVSPPRVSWEGPTGGEQSTTVSLYNRGTQPIYFSHPPTPPPQVQLSTLPQVLVGGRSTPFTITWVPVDGGPLRSQLVIPYGVGAVEGTLEIALRGAAQRLVHLVPETLDFGSTSAGDSYTKQVAVVNRSMGTVVLNRGALEPVSPAADAPEGLAEWFDIPATVQIGPGEVGELTVVFSPQRAGAYEVAVPFVQAAPDGQGIDETPRPVVVLTIRADVDLPLHLLIHELDFGEQPVLKLARRPLPVENRGSAPLDLSLRLLLRQGVFSYPPLDFLLVPGERLDIPLYFRPIDMMSYGDTLVLSYTTFEEKHETKVVLGGAGLDRPLQRLAQIEDLILEEDFPGWYRVVDLRKIFEDANHQVTYQLSHSLGLRVGLTVSPDDRLMLSTAPHYHGAGDVIVQAINELGEMVADSFRLVITPVNDLPELVAPIPDLVVKEDTPPFLVGRLSEIFVDPDRALDTVVTDYTIYSPTGEDHIRLTKRMDDLILEVDPDWHGTASFVVTARDANDTNVVVFDAFKVTILAVNDPPQLNALPDLFLDEDDTLRVDWQPYIHDRDNADYELTLSFASEGSGPPPIAFEQESLLQTVVRPRPDWSGKLPVRLRVTDPMGAAASRNFVITVRPVNDPPGPFHALEPITLEWEQRLRYGGPDTLLTFKWELSPNLDPDDNLVYTWQLLDSTGQRIIQERPAGLANSVQTQLGGAGLFYWTVKVRDIEGATASSDTVPIMLESLQPQPTTGPEVLALSIGPNYPNPLSEYTQIEYGIPKFSDVVITIYDAMGRKVRALRTEKQYRGQYVVDWDGRDQQGQRVASGPYVVELRAGALMAHLKVVVVH